MPSKGFGGENHDNLDFPQEIQRSDLPGSIRSIGKNLAICCNAA
jgi:hypothetical protein